MVAEIGLEVKAGSIVACFLDEWYLCNATVDI